MRPAPAAAIVCAAATLVTGAGATGLDGGAHADAAGRPTADRAPLAGKARRAGDAPPFVGKVSRIDAERRERMTGRSWHRGCPVPIRRLRLVRVRHWGFEGDHRRGRLVVHRAQAREVLRAMAALYRHRFPIRRIEVIDAYGGDDRRSMSADNTSAFNCRFVAGRPGVWSQHAYGRAVDVNPVENPYVSPSGHVSPPAGAPYADRSRRAKGMIHAGDSTVRAFRRVGWRWGGAWSGTRDYQHFSASGR